MNKRGQYEQAEAHMLAERLSLSPFYHWLSNLGDHLFALSLRNDRNIYYV